LEILTMRRALLSAVAIAVLAPRFASPADDGLEYQVKAAFLFNFLKFVEWPPAASGAPWVIGVLGHDPFGDVLDRTVQGKTVNGHGIEVRRYTRVADVRGCNVLFVGRADFARVGIPDQPGLLTVGESPGFIKAGGIINFYLEENRVHFEIRPSAAHSAGLQVSSQLLKLGRTL
jgi:hypothetical protein